MGADQPLPAGGVATLLGLRKIVDPTRAPYNCTLNDSSSGTAAANSTAFQRCMDTLGAAGGGIILIPPNGTLWLGRQASVTIDGIRYCTYLKYGNVEVWGHGRRSSFLGTKDDGAVIVVSGAINAGGPDNAIANNPKRSPISAIAAIASAGAASVTVTGGQSEITRLGITVGDDILLATGQCVDGADGEPDGEIHQVAALPGSGVISLAAPTIKPYKQEYYPTADVIQTTLSGAISAGATSCTVASATSLFSRGWINAGGNWISYSTKTGNTLGGLQNVPAGGVSNGAAVYQGQGGSTSATVTSFPARLGVSRVTGLFLRGVAFRNIGFDAQFLGDSGGGVIEGGYTIGMEFDRVYSIASRPLKLHTMSPGLHAKNIQCRHVGGGFYHDIGVDTCSTGCVIEDFDLVSDGIAFVHSHEGSELRLVNGRIRSTGQTVGNADSSSNAVSIRSRAYGTYVDNVTINHPDGYGPAVSVGGDCTAGGYLGPGLRFIGGMTQAAISVSRGALGWFVAQPDLSLAPSSKVAIFATQFRSPVMKMSAWLIFDATSSSGTGGTAPSVQLGVLPQNARALSCHVEIVDVFDGTGTNTIDVGWTASPNALASGVDASLVGLTNGAGGQIGVQRNGNQTIVAKYNGTAGVHGSAMVTVEYELTQQKP